MSDIPIAALLEDLGYRSPEAQRAARAAMEAAGLTNPRKRNIAESKREAVAEALAERLVRTCGSARCRRAVAHDPRPHVVVDRKACQVCGGSPNAAAAARMVEAMRRAGHTRLLVVGGSPNSRAELRRLLDGSGIVLQVVDGTTAVPARRAQSWAGAADVIAVWGSTMLDHKVSDHFTGPAYREKRAITAQRGIAALADAVTKHLERAPAVR